MSRGAGGGGESAAAATRLLPVPRASCVPRGTEAPCAPDPLDVCVGIVEVSVPPRCGGPARWAGERSGARRTSRAAGRCPAERRADGPADESWPWAGRPGAERAALPVARRAVAVPAVRPRRCASPPWWATTAGPRAPRAPSRASRPSRLADRRARRPPGSPTAGLADRRARRPPGSPTAGPADRRARRPPGSPTAGLADRRARRPPGSPTAGPADRRARGGDPRPPPHRRIPARTSACLPPLRWPNPIRPEPTPCPVITPPSQCA